MVPTKSTEVDSQAEALQQWLKTHSVELDKPTKFGTFCGGLLREIQKLPTDTQNLKETSKATKDVLLAILNSISMSGRGDATVATTQLKNLNSIVMKVISPASVAGYLKSADFNALDTREKEIREDLNKIAKPTIAQNVAAQAPGQTSQEQAETDALKDIDEKLEKQFIDLQEIYDTLVNDITNGIPDYAAEFTITLSSGRVSKNTNVYYTVVNELLNLKNNPELAALKKAAGRQDRDTSLAKDVVTQTWERYEKLSVDLLSKIEDVANRSGLVHQLYESDPRLVNLLAKKVNASGKTLTGASPYPTELKELKDAADEFSPAKADLPGPFHTLREEDLTSVNALIEDLETNEWLHALPTELAILKQKNIDYANVGILPDPTASLADIKQVLETAEQFEIAQKLTGLRKATYDELAKRAKEIIHDLEEAAKKQVEVAELAVFTAAAQPLKDLITISRSNFTRATPQADTIKQITALEEAHHLASQAGLFDKSGKKQVIQEAIKDLEQAYDQAHKYLIEAISEEPLDKMEMSAVLNEILPKMVPNEERMIELKNRYFALMGSRNYDPYREAVYRNQYGIHFVEIAGDSGSKAFDITYDKIFPELADKTVRFAGLARSLFLMPPIDRATNLPREGLTVDELNDPNLTKVNERALQCYFYIIDRIKDKYGGITKDPTDPTDDEFSYVKLVGDTVDKFKVHLSHKFPDLAQAKNIIGNSILGDIITYTYATGAKSVGYAAWLARETTRSHGSNLAMARGDKPENEMVKAAPFAEGIYSRGRYGNNIMNQTGEDFLFMSKEVAQRIQPGGDLLGPNIKETIHTAEAYWKIVKEGWPLYLSRDFWNVNRMPVGAQRDQEIAGFLKKYSASELTDAYLQIMFMSTGPAREQAIQQMMAHFSLSGSFENLGESLNLKILSEAAAASGVAAQRQKEQQFANQHTALGPTFERIGEKLPYGGPVYGKVDQLEKIITAGEMWDLVNEYRVLAWGAIPNWVQDMRRMIGIGEGKLDLYKTWMPLVGEVVPRCMEIEVEKRKILTDYANDPVLLQQKKTEFERKYAAQGYSDDFNKIGLATLNDDSLDLNKYNVTYRAMEMFTDKFQTEAEFMNEEQILAEWKDWMDKVIGKIKLVPGPHHYMFGPQTMRMLCRLVTALQPHDTKEQDDHYVVESLIMEMLEQMKTAGGLPGHVKDYVSRQVLDGSGKIQNIRQFLYEDHLYFAQKAYEKTYYGKLLNVKQKHKTDWRARLAQKLPFDWLRPKPEDDNYLVRPWNFKEKKKESNEGH